MCRQMCVQLVSNFRPQDVRICTVKFSRGFSSETSSHLLTKAISPRTILHRITNRPTSAGRALGIHEPADHGVQGVGAEGVRHEFPEQVVLPVGEPLGNRLGQHRVQDVVAVDELLANIEEQRFKHRNGVLAATGAKGNLAVRFDHLIAERAARSGANRSYLLKFPNKS